MDNLLINDVNRASQLSNGFLNGDGNIATSWNDFASGTANYIDGKISGGIGNTNIVTANDSVGLGNQCSVGRRMYRVESQGISELPGIGLKAYVVVHAREGDITGFFPNVTLDSRPDYVLATYGPGATCVDGCIYPRDKHSPDDLTWAMHPYCFLKDSAIEIAISLEKIIFASFNPTIGTTIYYDREASLYDQIAWICGSYAPTVFVYNVNAGTGNIGEGIWCSTYGYAAHAEGYETRAWHRFTHSQGHCTQALGLGSHAGGEFTTAQAQLSTVFGRWNIGGGAINEWKGDEFLFELGNGTSADHRANAFSVKKSGDVTVQSKLEVGKGLTIHGPVTTDGHKGLTISIKAQDGSDLIFENGLLIKVDR